MRSPYSGIILWTRRFKVLAVVWKRFIGVQNSKGDSLRLFRPRFILGLGIKSSWYDFFITGEPFVAR